MHEGPLSRAELSRSTGLSRPSVSTLIEQLMEAGLVTEFNLIKDGSGRPARPVDLNRCRMHLVGIEVGATFVESVVTDLDGQQIEFQHQDMPVRTAPEQTISFMQQLISDIVKRVNDRGGLVLGVGIGLASPLSGPNADTFSSSLYPAWVDFQFGAILSR